MSFFKRLLPKRWIEREDPAPSSPPAPPEPAPESAPSPRTISGFDWSMLYSSPLSLALSVATVYRCVTFLCDSVAVLPCRFLRAKDGRFVPDGEDRLNYLLTIQPNHNMSGFDFWWQVILRVLIDGNAYIVPLYNPVSMSLDALMLCGRNTVSHDTVNDIYTVMDTVNGISGTYYEREIIHIKGMTLDGKHGMSVLSYARLTSRIASSGDDETLKRFVNGGNVKGVVSNDKSVRGFGEYQDKELKKTAESVDDLFQSGANIVSLPGQVDFKQISLSSTDMQFLESRKFTVREICRFFGVHPSFVFDDTSNNYKSAEMANVAFLNNTLNPILRKIETELLRKLVAPSLAMRYRFEFNRRSLYACDLESRSKYWQQAMAAGLYTVNELRAEENRPAVPDGDRVLVSANLRLVSELTADGKAPAGNNDNTPAADADDDNDN